MSYGKNKLEAKEVFAAAERGDSEQVRTALHCNPSLATARDPSGLTLLAYAAIYGDTVLVSLFLHAGAEPNARDRYGNTILHNMAYNGHNGDDGYDAVARLLIEAGVEVNARVKGETALTFALGCHRLVDDDHRPVAGASEILRGFISVLQEHGAVE